MRFDIEKMCSDMVVYGTPFSSIVTDYTRHSKPSVRFDGAIGAQCDTYVVSFCQLTRNTLYSCCFYVRAHAYYSKNLAKYTSVLYKLKEAMFICGQWIPEM